ncbi:MAG: hypothetical protein DRJ98_00465 [Thermoprotei archaeon]|nr:MAG: hypothetical protein DRJ98_00465 [Thermoprotei archaeon]RLF18357.1 MAG: hypothetical protein DRN06_01675 [Thermoprotei archaeon]
MSSQGSMREAAYALGMGLDLLVFALVGYFAGKHVLGDEALGIGLGILVGTLLMWYHAYSLIKAIRRRRGSVK